MTNPFPGPQPYRASDRDRFFGREDMALRLEDSVVTNRCVTVYGPSGAGKSSLMQASVIPSLIASRGVRAVRMDGWPEGEDPSRWLAGAVYAQLGLGDVPRDIAPGEAIVHAAQRTARKSPRLMLVYLDQIEQILYSGRAATDVERFLEDLQTLVELPIRNVRLVLSLREDYLGRFRDRASDRGRLLENGFRVGPLTVAELRDAVCQTAKAGTPSQDWSLEAMREVILQVRVPGEAATDAAEAQAAYAQIVCRALFQERAQQREGQSVNVIEAEPILRRYLDATLDELGPLGSDARRLLEDHLVTADGTRTLRTENELLRILPQNKLAPILVALERAAILHAEARQGSRYFEIGHDWLARKVYEQRREREREDEERKRTEAHEEQLRKERAETSARQAKETARLRFLGALAVVSIVVATGAAAMSVWAFGAQKEAKEAGHKAELAKQEAFRRAIEASDARLLAGFRELKNSGQLAWGTKLLAEVQLPGAARGWVALASDALRSSALERTLTGHGKVLSAAAWSPDGKRILTASADGTARIWDAEKPADPVVLKGDDSPMTLAAWRPDGKQVLIATEGGTVRLLQADGTGEAVTLNGSVGTVVAAIWSGDGTRVVAVSRDDATARIWSASGGWIELIGHTAPIRSVAFHPDGERVLTASDDGTARIWSVLGFAAQQVFPGHKAEVLFVAPSPDGTRFVTTSRDRTARIWSLVSKGLPVVLEGHQGSVESAAWSPDNSRVATASTDRSARIWSVDGLTEPVVLKGHAAAVTSVAFRADGRYVATASADKTARIWPVEGGVPLVLSGHDGPVRTAVWSPDGLRVLTAAGAPEKRVSSADFTARIWRTASLPSLARPRVGFFHAAFLDGAGKVVVAAFDDQTARLWPFDGNGAAVVFEGHTDWVTSASLSRDGKRVVTTSFDETARLWSADGTLERELRGHSRAVRAAAFSADGAWIATASDDMTARVWSVDSNANGTGEPIILRGHSDALSAVVWSPTDKQIATSSLDGTARIWRADGSLELSLEGHAAAVNAVAWSRDGLRVATVSDDGTAQIWDAKNGAPLFMLEHKNPVLAVVWSPDGTRLATSSADGKLRVWSADGKGEPVELEAGAPLLALMFGEDGKTIVGVGADDTTSTWTIDIGVLRQGLAVSNADCLSALMRVTYFGEAIDDATNRSAACDATREHIDAGVRAVDVGALGNGLSQAPSGPKAGRGVKASSIGASEHRVAVFVVPGDALVEVDGKPVRRRDGVVEILVKTGFETVLKASMGVTPTKVPEKSTTLEEAVMNRGLVDLNEKLLPGKDGKVMGAKPKNYGFDEQ